MEREGPRRLVALIAGLPPDAALWRRLQGATGSSTAERIKQKYAGANVVSIDEFVASNRQHVA